MQPSILRFYSYDVVIKHEFEPRYVPCNEMAMIIVFFCLVPRIGLTCFAVCSCGFVLSALPSLASVLAIPVLSLSSPGLLELFEENKLVNKVKD